MELLNFTDRERETYNVQIKFSLLWECALGIAAFTNTPLLETLDKPVGFWSNLKKTFSKEMLGQLEFVEKNNTWKSLLQLLHKEDFSNLTEFSSYIEDLSNKDLKFTCLPFLGDKHQNLREEAALANLAAIEEMTKLTVKNPFLPRYIEFICSVEPSFLKEHLIKVISSWYHSVVEKELETYYSILETDYRTKHLRLSKMYPEELVKWATGGVVYKPEPSVHSVLLIPQFVYRPWNIEADIEGKKVFYYPVANESITPDDKYTPNNSLILKHKALGDEARLRIIKLLNESTHTLQEMSRKLDIGKSTIHHHLKILRAARLVEISESKYSLRRKVLDSIHKEMEQFLNQ
jgi:hypothetical protein